jgi:hypothetical protein
MHVAIRMSGVKRELNLRKKGRWEVSLFAFALESKRTINKENFRWRKIRLEKKRWG